MDTMPSPECLEKLDYFKQQYTDSYRAKSLNWYQTYLWTTLVSTTFGLAAGFFVLKKLLNAKADWYCLSVIGLNLINALLLFGLIMFYFSFFYFIDGIIDPTHDIAL